MAGIRRISTRICGLALLGMLTACGAQSAGTGAAPAPAPAASSASHAPDIFMDCKSYDDPLGEGALGSGPTAKVTMTTDAYVAASQINVTVIEFGKSGAQVGTDTITFSGPFASGQIFTGEPESTNGDTYSCGIASVTSSTPLVYDNLSPVPGDSSGR